MENQSGQAPDGMADQRFRSWLTEQLNMQQQNAGCSSNPAPAVIQMPALPSHTDYGGIYPKPTEYDGYNWRICGQKVVQGGCHQKFYYECAHANCGAEKSVTRSADGQIKKTVCKGSHNHPRSSERVFGDGSATLDAIPVGEILQAAGVIRPSVAMPRNEEEDELQSGSSDSEEDDASEARVDGDGAGADANAIERHGAAQEITAQTATEVDVTGNDCQQRKNYCRSGNRRSKSKVWEEFTAVFSGGKIQNAECKHCKKCLSGKTSGGTSHLRRHLKICPAQCRNTRVQQNWSSSRLDSSAANNWKFHQETSLELLTRALVSNLCPFSVTSGANFRKFLTGISPAYSIVPQASVEAKFLSIFQNEKVKLKEAIALTPGGVFLSVTSWELELKYFLCFTVHFIDKEWKMNRKVIRCACSGIDVCEAEHYLSVLPNWKSYSNIRMAKYVLGGTVKTNKALIKEAAQDWNLEKKLLGIAFPMFLGNEVILDLEETMIGIGAAQNYLLAKYKLLTVPCMIDALHGLFDYSLEKFVLETSREWFAYMTCSALRLEKYKEILSRLHLNRPSFGSKQWYLTFYLFEATLQFNKELPNPEEMDLQNYPPKPSLQSLEAAKNFCDLARPIYHAVDVLSRHNATFNSHFHAIWNLGTALRESSVKFNIERIINVDDMKKNFDNLWRKCNLWLSMAVFLDPRFKLRYLEHCFKQVFGTGAKLILEVRAKIYELFLQYSCNADQQSDELLNHRNTDLQMDRHGNDSLHGTNQIDIGQLAHGEFRELTLYLEGELYPQNDQFDILKWWKDNASTYPTLARLARDILAIPGSAVSAESAFDENDERASLFNRKLSPEIIEALICTQDWIKSSETGDENGGS